MSRVIIRPVQPSGAGIAFDLVGDDVVTGGMGGWEVIPRPRRTAAVEWVGVPARSRTLPLMLSGVRERGAPQSVEAQLRRLEKWGRVTRATRRPPILRVTGRGLSMPGTTYWVINGDIGFSDVLRDRHGRRFQAEISLPLTQYIAPTVVRRPAARARSGRS